MVDVAAALVGAVEVPGVRPRSRAPAPHDDEPQQRGEEREEAHPAQHCSQTGTATSGSSVLIACCASSVPTEWSRQQGPAGLHRSQLTCNNLLAESGHGNVRSRCHKAAPPRNSVSNTGAPRTCPNDGRHWRGTRGGGCGGRLRRALCRARGGGGSCRGRRADRPHGVHLHRAREPVIPMHTKVKICQSSFTTSRYLHQ